MVAIIDYDAGNIKSIEKAVSSLKYDSVLTRDSAEIERADHVILPGVGSFGDLGVNKIDAVTKDAMEKLQRYELVNTIKGIANRGVPFLGICLGQQLLFESSEESPGVEGLGLLEGTVRRIPAKQDMKVPNIGWNSLDIKGGRLFEGIEPGAFVYFVHSYYVHSQDRDIVKATIDYGVEVDASVEKGNIFATQFHPEKSSSIGLKILESFLKIGA